MIVKNFWKSLAILACSLVAFCSCDDVEGIDFDDAQVYGAESAYAYYYGSSEVEGCVLYGLSLFVGDVTEKYEIADRGLELYLELLCPESAAQAPSSGEYKPALSTSIDDYSHTFALGTIQEGVIYGSYLANRKGDVSEIEYEPVLGGSLEIRRKGNSYEIKASVVAGQDPVVFQFDGDCPVIDCSSSSEGDGGNGGSGDTGGESDITSGQNFSFSNYTKGELDYYGKEDGYYCWGIYLGDNNINLEDLSGSGHLAMALLYTNSSSKTVLPAGTYTVSSTIGDMVAEPIYQDSEGYYGGTMYLNDDMILVGATSGTIKVSKSGSNYTVEMDLVDGDYNNTYKGSYTGPLNIFDSSSRKAVARHAHDRRTSLAKVRGCQSR